MDLFLYFKLCILLLLLQVKNVPQGVSLVAQMVKNLPAMQETWIQSIGQEDTLEKGMATHSSILGLPLWLSSACKESACNAGDLDSIPGLGRFPREWNSSALQYSDLENPMDYIVHGVAKSQTRLSDFHSLILFYR